MSFRNRFVTIAPRRLMAMRLIAGLIVIAGIGRTVIADDEPPAKQPPAADAPLKNGESKDSDAAGPADKKDSGSGQPSLLDKLSKELFKDLDEEPKQAAQKENKLDRVAKGMRNAGENLDGQQTGEETRKIQKQVIKDLEELINQLQNPPPQGGGGGGGGGASSTGGGGGKSGQNQKSGSGQMSKSEQRNGKEGGAAGLNKSGGQEKKVAEGSQERTDSERKAADEAARKKKLEMDIWGHLPAHLREQLSNTYGERTLLKYQQLVKQFYETLSEQEDSPRR